MMAIMVVPTGTEDITDMVADMADLSVHHLCMVQFYSGEESFERVTNHQGHCTNVTLFGYDPVLFL